MVVNAPEMSRQKSNDVPYNYSWKAARWASSPSVFAAMDILGRLGKELRIFPYYLWTTGYSRMESLNSFDRQGDTSYQQSCRVVMRLFRRLTPNNHSLPLANERAS